MALPLLCLLTDFFLNNYQNGRTALICAAIEGQLDIVVLLLDRKANIEAAENVKDLQM